MSQNMYPNVPSAPEYEPDQTKMYPPLQAQTGVPYPMPPPYSESMPQQHSSAQQPHPSSSVTTTIVVVDSFPAKSIQMKCYYCNEDIRTRVKPQATCLSWLLCSLLCIFGCFCGCCLIPFCTSGTRDMLHYCPKCKKYLGVHERMRFPRR